MSVLIVPSAIPFAAQRRVGDSGHRTSTTPWGDPDGYAEPDSLRALNWSHASEACRNCRLLANIMTRSADVIATSRRSDI
jgi:hypothetical protein